MSKLISFYPFESALSLICIRSFMKNDLIRLGENSVLNAYYVASIVENSRDHQYLITKYYLLTIEFGVKLILQ